MRDCEGCGSLAETYDEDTDQDVCRACLRERRARDKADGDEIDPPARAKGAA